MWQRHRLPHGSGGCSAVSGSDIESYYKSALFRLWPLLDMHLVNVDHDTSLFGNRDRYNREKTSIRQSTRCERVWVVETRVAVMVAVNENDLLQFKYVRVNDWEANKFSPPVSVTWASTHRAFDYPSINRSPFSFPAYRCNKAHYWNEIGKTHFDNTNGANKSTPGNTCIPAFWDGIWTRLATPQPQSITLRITIEQLTIFLLVATLVELT